MNQNLSDAELISLFTQKGEKEALGVLFNRYSAMALSVAAKYYNDKDTARDVCMQVFEKLMTLLHKHEIDNFKSWLYRVVKNECLMQLRKKQDSVAGSLEEEKKFNRIMESSLDLHPEEVIDKERKLQSLENAIEMLEPRQKLCIELFFLKEKSYAEIVAETGFELLQVKSCIQNGKRNLQIKMGKIYQ
jgi:RNA polymerase sigma-70 factor (ECF subfamily)